MSYNAFKSSPLAVESIIRPELSKIHLGVALRDYDWEMEHHMKPTLYTCLKQPEIKLVLQKSNSNTMDYQGAIQALIIARVPYRQAAEAAEISLKKHVVIKPTGEKCFKMK